MEGGQKDKKKRNGNKEEEEERERSGTLWKLPRDILLDIFSRIPAKPLFDCRLVCKSWLTLVRDPRLSTMHLTRALQKKTPSIIFEFSGNLYLLDNLEVSNVPLKLKFPFTGSDPYFELVGSCNGLVCVTEAPDFDPSIYTSKTCWSECAFCYHPPTNEYKVLRVVRRRNRENEAEIYTLSSNSWRKIKGTEIRCYGSSYSVVNGAIHWFSASLEMGLIHSPIISFDFGEEKFRVVRASC